MKEVWKDIRVVKNVDYLGHYQVSNLGRIKSLNRYRKNRHGVPALVRERILKLQYSQYGYNVICLSLNNKRATISVHQIVGIAFIPNPENKSQINHINGIKTDNRVENLEWATQKENIQHAYDTGLAIMTPERIGRLTVMLREIGIKRMRPILMLSLTDEPLLWFDSMKEAKQQFNSSIHISDVCSGKRKTAGGYKWQFYHGN